MDFLPNRMDSPTLRLVNLRNKLRFPDVNASWDWLIEIRCRVQEDIPPVSAADFEEWAQWFSANESRLYQLSAALYSLEVCEGRTLSLANLRCGLRQGVRATGTGELGRYRRAIYFSLRMVQLLIAKWPSGSLRARNLPRMVMSWPSFSDGASF